ncbi:uncharacterized protein EI90DRAFT_3021725 [Cantharellus anzutake]|uniref:uncharacterized protein n=1 Tax=Cantharellus anzutake TaxID=1750568 RepID=UPI0019051FE3|nr:uncharacterized protein EI90DRAFT_3021725 [Cantharellus anzutake]KAF8315981.1 hypothetical protein EI90DRAFT_3021725 [Cantharellus anzutake]
MQRTRGGEGLNPNFVVITSTCPRTIPLCFAYITGHLKVVKSLFDTDGNCHFKLRDVRQLLKEAQDEIEVLSRDNNNSTSKRKCADFSLAKSANDDLVALRTRVGTLEHQLDDTEGILTATKSQLQSHSQSCDEVSVQLDASRESESSLKHKIQLLTEYEAEVMQLRITKAENACIPSLRVRIEELLDLGRLRGVELQFAPANGQIANLDDLVKALQTSLLLGQEKAKQCTTLKESEAEKLVAQVESTTIANQERFLSKSASIPRVILNGALQLLEQEIQQQAAELACKEKEYVVYQNTILQSKTEVDRKEEIIASFSHEIDKAAKAMLKVESELASVQSKPADAEKLSAVTAAKLDSADLTISDLREQHTGLKAQNASLASELTSETNSALRSIAVAKDEIKEKLVERNSAHRYRSIDKSARRYKSEAERAVVKDVMETCQRSLKQQLVAKWNDICRTEIVVPNVQHPFSGWLDDLSLGLGVCCFVIVDFQVKATTRSPFPPAPRPDGKAAFDVRAMAGSV